VIAHNMRKQTSKLWTKPPVQLIEREGDEETGRKLSEYYWDRQLRTFIRTTGRENSEKGTCKKIVIQRSDMRDTDQAYLQQKDVQKRLQHPGG